MKTNKLGIPIYDENSINKNGYRNSIMHIKDNKIKFKHRLIKYILCGFCIIKYENK